MTYLEKASKVKHSLDIKGNACVEFRVRHVREDGNANRQDLIIKILQDNQSLVSQLYLS